MPGVSVDDVRLRYTLRLGDNALVLSQRLIELVASGPELEEELANANIALDYLGQARMFYSYAGELEGQGRDEDDFAFLRDAPEFENVLLVEQPNGHFGDTIVRQVLFDSFYGLQLDALCHCADEGLREICTRYGDWFEFWFDGGAHGPAQGGPDVPISRLKRKRPRADSCGH